MFMKNLKKVIPALVCLFGGSAALTAQETPWVITPPACQEYTAIDREGDTWIPNGRRIHPAGVTFEVAPHPYGLALSGSGKLAVTANSGTGPLSITILRNLDSGSPEIRQVPPGPSTDGGVLASVFMGLAVSPDEELVYVAGGQENKVFTFNTTTGEKAGAIDCSFKSNSVDYTHGYIGDMVLSRDGSRLYAVDQVGFRLVVIDVPGRKLLSNIEVGRYPFGIALSPDESTVYVANVGMYRYSLVKRKKEGKWQDGTLDYPAFAYGSPEAEDGIHSDSLDIPGLGPIGSDKAFSVWAVDVRNPVKPRVISKTRTGTLVGQMVEDFPAVGGSSPNSVVASDRYVFISNGNNDNITVLDARKHRIVKHIQLSPDPRVAGWRGIIPFGLALSPDGKRLYVAEAGINAVGVIDAATFEVLGHIPAGWFPAKLKVTPDGKKLVISNAKGYGSGPNGGTGYTAGPEGTYIGNLMNGTVQVVDIPGDNELQEYTRQVVSNNFRFSKPIDQVHNSRANNPVPLFPGRKDSPIRHIIFISKENRTYDEVFGQVMKGNGDATLARYGANATFTNRDKSLRVSFADVMPNHLQLARQFGISDNFYVDSDVSADGHRWLVNTYPNEWVEATTPANYGGNRDYKWGSNAPGNLGLNGASGAIYPEDYNEAGSMWDQLSRHGIDFFNFGFGVMFEPADYQDTYKYFGVKELANFPMPAPMYDRTSRVYPTYNTAIPDQFRIDMFIKEFNEKWGEGKATMPSLLTVIIPNDHGAGERPEAGYPFRESYMADNDLAVGRIVEFLSHTPYWKNMAIVITEDDAQNGVDHVDAHRSILMVISPYAKKDHVSHVHNSFGSIFKTFWNILGIPYLNQYDAGANDLSDFFTDIPDFTPYLALPVDSRIFDPQKALDPFDEKFNWKSLREGPAIDNPFDMIRESKEQEEWRREGQK